MTSIIKVGNKFFSLKSQKEIKKNELIDNFLFLQTRILKHTNR